MISKRPFLLYCAACSLVLVMLLTDTLGSGAAIWQAALAPAAGASLTSTALVVSSAPGSDDSPPRLTRDSAPALPAQTGDALLNQAEAVALHVLQRNAENGLHIAAQYYDSPWVRDSFAWGMIPAMDGSGSALTSYAGTELAYWLPQQRADDTWITNIWSGYYDETPILIAAIADRYRIDGNRQELLAALPQAERAWASLAQNEVRPAAGSRYLLYAAVGPHIAADWVDQVAKSGYATGIEALWYHATLGMASMEAAVGNAASARRYTAFATGISQDINRLLWRVGAPQARNAAPVGAFGHYTGWLGPRDYFELDSNFLCILYGIASPAQTASILRFTSAHARYLLGLDTTGGLPARAVYGDYQPADYARIHDRLADGTYQNGYWPSVGALVALAAAHAGNTRLAQAILRQLAAGFVRDQDISEWYTAAGRPSGAAAYQWPARMFLIALYGAYLGLDDDWQAQAATGQAPPHTRCIGSGLAALRTGSRNALATITAGSAGGQSNCSISLQATAPQGLPAAP